MNIDERLEKLTARHEAMAQSLELMQHMWEDRWNKITAAIEEDGENIRKDGENIRKITAAIELDAENIRGLARIAELQHERLARLEDKPQ